MAENAACVQCSWQTAVMNRGCVMTNVMNLEEWCLFASTAASFASTVLLFHSPVAVERTSSCIHEACTSVTRCIRQIQAVIVMQVGGLHIRVDRAGQSAHGSAGGSVMYERNRTVFVGNLPFDVEVGFPPSCSCDLH